jgi:hypothetical protein
VKILSNLHKFTKLTDVRSKTLPWDLFFDLQHQLNFVLNEIDGMADVEKCGDNGRYRKNVPRQRNRPKISARSFERDQLCRAQM